MTLSPPSYIQISRKNHLLKVHSLFSPENIFQYWVFHFVSGHRFVNGRSQLMMNLRNEATDRCWFFSSPTGHRHCSCKKFIIFNLVKIEWIPSYKNYLEYFYIFGPCHDACKSFFIFWCAWLLIGYNDIMIISDSWNLAGFHFTAGPA